ncbi:MULTISPECIES: ABC transporter permease [unclassified Paenibacillus]|uniref:ABC transporter permease n=1 Tax=unclassified Paenibacillus TaxID=185978 RepID=UPI00240680F8|nr:MULTISPECIES: ABC transporter permease [unclassified Paenibacillus]MDF9839754.1 ABC-type nitrate/sulfonate/bicarbonate transport system permease component [Paenibacillus sp. PastF-2]MDF9846334.1 ABC-type nitrate/sulfonate/bicarbonate transport system permease component [Paenibacillus sp. PastM-2]MDF9853316.1 ABC-type nitrate/sulfonate/bicarbonate transport system permease component [Paenibacillus sp. PastF-1]MDH6478180.1 ABC-type nitrate/sulfonate/bicarbonate transport system permease compon
MNTTQKMADSPAAEIPRLPEGMWTRLYYRNERMILGASGVVVLLLIWEAIVRLGLIDPLFSSSPVRIWHAGVQYVTSDGFANDFIASGTELMLGFGLALIVGIPLGIAMGWYPKFNHVVEPIFNFLYAAPRIALVPLFIIWFGIDLGSKVAIIFLSSVFPIIFNTLLGVKTIDPVLLNVPKSYNAKSYQIFKTVVLPSSVPAIISGIRLGLGHALIGVVVGEMTAATMGVGHMMFTAGQTFQTDLVFVGLIIIAGFGVVLTGLVQILERHFDKWRVDIHN